MHGTLSNLQALRGAACLLVVLYHLGQMERGFGLGFAPLRALPWFGYAGVDLFFVLSGFIIAATNRARVGDPRAVPGFVARRAWRVYPVYWAALAVGAAHFEWAHPGALAATTAGEWVGFVLLLPPGLGEVPRFVPVAWSMSCEIMFYLAFAGLVALPRRVGGVLLAGWAAAVLWATLAPWHSLNQFVAQALGQFVLEFLAGVLVAHLPGRLSARATWGLAAAAAGWAAAGLGAFAGPHPDRLATDIPHRVLTFGVPAALIVYAAVARERAGGRVRWRWLLAAGDASYSIYLVHTPAMSVVLYASLSVGWGHSRWPHLAWLAVTFATAVGAGVLLYVAVERPVLRLVKGRKKAAEPARVLPFPAEAGRRAA